MARVAPKKAKFGLAGVPLEKGLDSVKMYFYTELEKKDYIPIVKDYVKRTYSREDARNILSNPDSSFNFFNYAAYAYWMKAGFEVPEKTKIAIDRFFNEKLEEGKKVVVEVQEERKERGPILSPADRLKLKVQETIFGDIDVMIDDWMDSKRTEIDIFKLVTNYDLKGIAISFIEQKIRKIHDEYEGAYEKTCDQLVEGYSYLKKTDLKWYVGATQRMLDDLSKLKASRKAARVPKAKKAPSAEKQVAKLQFKNTDSSYKLQSISPLLIIGASKLYVFNTKYRKLTVYSANSMEGLKIKGTTITNFSEETSHTMTLRKPDETISDVLNVTAAKANKLIDSLNVKKSTPNGRINNETILLKVFR